MQLNIILDRILEMNVSSSLSVSLDVTPALLFKAFSSGATAMSFASEYLSLSSNLSLLSLFRMVDFVLARAQGSLLFQHTVLAKNTPPPLWSSIQSSAWEWEERWREREAGEEEEEEKRVRWREGE